MAAAYSLSHASAETRAAQPAKRSASVDKLAIVGVWPLFNGSRIAVP
jgi:hypothetical protein